MEREREGDGKEAGREAGSEGENLDRLELGDPSELLAAIWRRLPAPARFLFASACMCVFVWVGSWVGACGCVPHA